MQDGREQRGSLYFLASFSFRMLLSSALLCFGSLKPMLSLVFYSNFNSKTKSNHKDKIVNLLPVLGYQLGYQTHKQPNNRSCYNITSHRIGKRSSPSSTRMLPVVQFQIQKAQKSLNEVAEKRNSH